MVYASSHPYFARYFMSGILAAIEYEGIPSLK
jgi:hypothetical protein